MNALCEVEDGFDLRRIPALEDRHVWQRAQHRDVLDGLVSDAAGRNQAGEKAQQTDRQVGIRDRHGQLIVRPTIEEHCKGVHEREEPFAGQTSGKAHHVLLRHAHREKSVRKRLLELVCLARPCQVGRQHDDLRFVLRPADKVSRVRAGDDLDHRTSCCNRAKAS